MHKHILIPLTVIVFSAAIFSCEKPTPYIERKTKDPINPENTVSSEKLSLDFLNANETVKAMGAGWNLGNTLDANSGDTTNMWIEKWTERRPYDYEESWGQVPASRELMHMMREAGFRAIRIPVTWYPHMGAEFAFDGPSLIWSPTLDPIGNKVDDVWMARVKQVVDYVLAEDMYCIVNVHHDTGTANTHWLVASGENYAGNSARFKSLWTQIAETFKDYDGRLLFEAYNEMTDAADSWCFASFNTPNRYDAAMALDAYSTINAYAQDFVDAVRATGGNNENRNLIVNTYAAACGDGDWNTHLKDPLLQMKLPEDKVDGHLIFQVHYYPEFSSLTEGKAGVDAVLASLNTNLASKGAPVIIGEWGCGGNSKVSYDTNRTSYLKFAQYFVEKAKSYGMATFYWMGISDGEDRALPKFTQPDLKDAIIQGVQ